MHNYTSGITNKHWLSFLAAGLAGVFIAIVILNTASATSKTVQTVNVEQRVACQTIIEDIRWSHRIWPEVNKSPRPRRSEILSDEQIRAKVEESLRMEIALADKYGIEITEAMLQAEMDRMARSTKSPERLQELFDALNNDPVTIAECLARPMLVKNKLYNSYVWDRHQHGHLRERAENVLAGSNNPDLLPESGGQEYRLALMRKHDDAETEPTADVADNGFRRIELDVRDFEREVNRLSGEKSDLAGMKENAERHLRETETSFVYEKILGQTEDSLEVSMLVWQKQEFNTWWATQLHEIDSGNQQVFSGKILLPLITGNASEEIQNTLSTTVADSWVASVSGFVPSARAGHTAIWTGSEMIIWGGRYDPVIDSWIPTTTTGAPSARRDYTAIWTGTEMIIWGGYNDYSDVIIGSGGRYDPITDSWIPTTTTGAPSGRNSHTAIWTGSEMIIWGGYDDSYPLVDTGGRYDPATDKWVTTNTIGAPAGRGHHTAIWTDNEMIIWGGSDDYHFATFDTGGRYDPATDKWVATSTTGAPSGRSSHTAIWTGSEMIIWGGYDSYGLVDTGGRYDPATDKWVTTNTIGAPSGRSGHTAIWAGSEMIVWGGGDYSYSTNTGGRYDPVADSWIPTNVTGAPSGRSDHTAIWTGSEMIVWEGSPYATNKGGRYDPVTDSWIAVNTTGAPTERHDYTVIWTGSEMIVWGGYDDSITNTGGLYNPVTDSWTATNTTGAPSGRYEHTAIWTGSEMIIWGGYPYTNIGGRYDPATDSWRATTSLAPNGRRNHTAIWTGSEMIVWGGRPYTTIGGRYNPVTDSWIATNIANAPNGRRGHTAIWTGSEMIVWGGYDNNTMTDTGGRYDPAVDNWIATNTIGAPSWRRSHVAIWTGSEMIVWGGYDTSDTSLETGGRYGPITDNWIPTNTTGAPDVSSQTAIWTGSEMIVFLGGSHEAVSAIYYPYSPKCTSGSRTLGPITYHDGDIIIEQVGGSLDTKDDVILEPGAMVRYEANDSIELNMGFHVHTGSTFSARVKSVICPVNP